MTAADSNLSRFVQWTLRATVALQCLGVGWWFLWIEETPLLAFLWGQPDVGGLGWSESAALALQRALGWFCVAVAPVVLVRPLAVVLVPLAGLQLLLAAAVVRAQGEYQLPWGWLPEPLAAYFPLVTHAARFAAPVGLMILDPAGANTCNSTRRNALGMACIRAAVVLTFLGHGIEAWTHYPRFVDYNILTINRLTGWEISQSTSEGLLTMMGAVDVAAALCVATCRWGPAIYYMAAWGLLTSVARPVVLGWELGWHELATRAPHFGLPLAIGLHWLTLWRSAARDTNEVCHHERPIT